MTRYLSPSPGSGPDRRRSMPLWLWAPLFFGTLSMACWLVSSCSSDGPVRRSDHAPADIPSYTPPAGASNVGSDVCAGCHAEQAKAYADTFHGKKIDPRTPAARQECETCHGPGSVHAENGGGKGTIMAFGSDSAVPPGEQAAKCLECHEKTRPMWQHGKHAARDVSCVDCHSVHHGHKNHQLKAEFQPDVCAGCHQPVSADLARNSHHPLREGKMVCTDCHNPHGSVGDKNLKGENPNDLCYKCHTEKRGPFLREHPPVTENCLNCHQPHGSQHRNLLVQALPYLCERCHAASTHQAVVDVRRIINGQGAGSLGPSQRAYLRSCENCHPMIHGSNHPSGEFFNR